MSHVCVIGAGAAGLAAALRLARKGIHVTILESGPRYSDAERAALFAEIRPGEMRGNPYRKVDPAIEAFRNDGEVEMPLSFERVRGVGGTTLFWLGNSPRMIPADFEMRSRFGVGEDWPIGYKDLEEFYAQAEFEIGIAGADDNPFAAPRQSPYPMPPIPFSAADRFIKKTMDALGYDLHHTPQARNTEVYGGRGPCLACGHCEVCPSGAKATFDRTHGAPAEKTGLVEIRTDATTLRIETDPTGRARRAIYAGLDRVERALEADVFILACGGIELPRLLLLSANRQFPDGLANRSGRVGMYLMNHPVVATQGLFERDLYPFRVNFESSESFQFYATETRDEFAALLMNVNNTGGPDPWKIANSSRLWGDAFEAHLREEFGHAVSLSAGVDQLPDEKNRVALDPDNEDYFGNPIPLVTYRFDEYTRVGMDRGRRIQEEILSEAGAKGFLPPLTWWPGHHMGTVRMGDDPETSVVDSNLRSHDISNLYMLTTGVYVTGGCANPTLTLTALALRLAEHLAGT